MNENETVPQRSPSEQSAPSEQAQSLAMYLRYQQPSDYHNDHLHLFAHLNRDAVQFAGNVKQPMVFREAMAALFSVVSSDYRYTPKDRTAYTAFMRMRRKNEHQGLMQAQRAYFDWLLNNDPEAWCVLDPVVSVTPDKLLFEVFSKDEGSYGLLSFDHTFFETQGDISYGTTNVDFSDSLAKGIEQIRSQHTTYFSIGQSGLNFKTETAKDLPDTEVLEKKVKLPNSWLRGFLQVQSSAQLPATTFALNPIDLYNTLHYLRMHGDIKGKRRGLKIELVPGENPLLVLEPNNAVIRGTAGVYKGNKAEVIRIWGRRRLALIQRFLPYADSVEVSLLGNGMPSFWVLKGQGVSLSFAITGFTVSNWSQALNFDLLLPRRSDNLDTLQAVTQYLKTEQTASTKHIAKACQLTPAECATALQQACQQGLVMFDIAEHQYRYRALTQEPLNMAAFQFRHPAEKHAYDLASRQQAIEDLDYRLLAGEGSEISANIKVKEDRRSYLSRLKLNEEGHVSKAECSCHHIMKHGLSHGPCSHLIALRLAYSAQQSKRDAKNITQETRLFSRRKLQKEEQFRLTLNKKRLQVEQDTTRRRLQQQFTYNSVEQARSAYLDKIQQLEYNGFVDTSL